MDIYRKCDCGGVVKNVVDKNTAMEQIDHGASQKHRIHLFSSRAGFVREDESNDIPEYICIRCKEKVYYFDLVEHHLSCSKTHYKENYELYGIKDPAVCYRLIEAYKK